MLSGTRVWNWEGVFLSFVSTEIVLKNPTQITCKYLFQVKLNFVWIQWEMLSIIIIIIIIIIIVIVIIIIIIIIVVVIICFFNL